MKLQLSLICLAFMILNSNAANAGVEISGGGTAVVCRDSSGRMSSAEVLDLYEARTVYNLNIPASSENFIDQAKSAARIIDHGAMGQVVFHDIVTDFAEKLHFLPLDTALKPIEDTEHFVVSKSCQLKQAARYDENGRIYVDSEIWAAMNETSRGALLLHEAVYYIHRLYGDKDSRYSRMIVAHAFSKKFENKSFTPVREGLPQMVEQCAAYKSDLSTLPWALFAAYSDPNNPDGTILQFVFLEGRPVLSKTIAILPGAKWPLSKLKTETRSTAELESILLLGKKVNIHIRSFDGHTGTIDIEKGLEMPSYKFTCTPVRSSN